MAAHVGLDPAKDIHWVTSQSSDKPVELFAEGKIDAFLGSPARCRRICAPGISATWSSTARWTARGRNISAACWRATASTCGKYPVATKRVLRAILKATDLCASDRALSRDGSSTAVSRARYDYALQTLK